MDGYGFQAQLNRISPVGVVPEGLRIDIGFAGNVSRGPLAGGTVEGVDYLLLRPDGVAVIDARERISCPDGSVVSARADGYVVPPFEMPDLSTLADPAFAWPDVDLPLHGSARLRSATLSREAVNRCVYGFTGAVNMARGSLVVDARAIGLDDSRAGRALLARGYEAFAAGDIPTVLGLFHPDIVWHEPGDNPLTGEYNGRDEVLGFFGRLQEMSGGSFHLDIHEITAGRDHLLALVTENASRGDARLAASAVHVWRLADGKLAEFTDHPADLAAVNRFWNDAASTQTPIPEPRTLGTPDKAASA